MACRGGSPLLPIGAATTHSSGEGAHPLAGERTCQRPQTPPHRWPPGCTRSVVLAVTKMLGGWHLPYSDFHSWLFFAPFCTSGCSRTSEKIQAMFAAIIYCLEVSISAAWSQSAASSWAFLLKERFE